MLTIRIPFAAASGVLFSLVVFLGLWQLVSVPLDTGPLVEARSIEFTRQIVETPVEIKRDQKVVRQPPVLEPTAPPVNVGGGDTIDVVRFTRPTFTRVDRTGGPNLRGVDGDAVPVIRPNPDYPPRALAAGIEGWAQVQFSVTTSGSVRDARIVASEPGTVFDDAALKAVARWRYNPRVESGVAVERVGLQAVLRFELEN